MDEIAHQCPTCGRVGEIWGDQQTKLLADSLTKTHQRRDKEDRTSNYRDWRWTFGDGCYVSDIDHIEWRLSKSGPTPVAILELSRVDGNVRIPPSYLHGVLQRFIKRDGQGATAIHFASMLQTEAWVVLFRWDLTEFWLYNLSKHRGWYAQITKAQYEIWIRTLGQPDALPPGSSYDPDGYFTPPEIIRVD